MLFRSTHDSIIKIQHDNSGFNQIKSEAITLRKYDNINVDEFNIKIQILDFFNPSTGELIKSIDLVKENPYIKAGFKRRKEPDPDNVFFLQMKGNEKKNQIRKYIPNILYDSIPNDFLFERALSYVSIEKSSEKYIVGSYILDWNDDAYEDNYELSGNGYSVSTIVVWDSLGNEKFSKQFDGYTLPKPCISIDGKYIGFISNLYPSNSTNNKLHLIIYDIVNNHLIYEEFIDNSIAWRSSSGFGNAGLPHIGFGISFINGEKRWIICLGALIYEFKNASLLDSYEFINEKEMKLIWMDGSESVSHIKNQLDLIKVIEK